MIDGGSEGENGTCNSYYAGDSGCYNCKNLDYTPKN